MKRPSWLRADSVLGQSALLLLAVLVVSQLLNLIAFAGLVIRPQVDRVAGLMAHNVSAIAMTMSELTPEQQKKFIARLSESPYLQFYEDGAPAINPGGRPNLLEYAFLTALEERLRGQTKFSWKRDASDRLWIATELAGKRYWISASPPQSLRPEAAVAIAVLTIFGISMAAGLIAQRRIVQPLISLTKAASSVSLTSKPKPIDVVAALEIKNLADSFNRMTARLAAAEQDREIMLAGVSHDLRTPLSKIRLAAEMIGDKDQDLKTLIVRQVESMDAMLSQFLDFARGVDAEPEVYTDVNELIASVALLHPGAQIDIRSPEPAFARVRPEALKRAISNLIGNALKYGRPPFSVETKIDHGLIKIAVRDGGPGIAAAETAALTQPFARGDAARGGTPGSGLGLAIVARVAQAHGGQLSFQQNQGRGFSATIALRGSSPVSSSR